MFKLIGFIMVIICVLGGFYLMEGVVSMLFKPVEVMIIYGTGIGAMLFSMSSKSIKAMFNQLLLLNKKNNTKAKNKELLLLLRDAIDYKRKKSPKELENEIDNAMNSPLFTKYPLITDDVVLFRFIADNIRYIMNAKPEPAQLNSLMQDEIDTIYEEQTKPSQSLFSLAEACPGLGVIAAVMGILITLGNIDGDVAAIGLGIATALVGTLLGMLGCYVIFKPLATALENNVDDDMAAYFVVKKTLCELCMNKPTLMAVDAGRRLINTDFKPTFIELEEWFAEEKGIAA